MKRRRKKGPFDDMQNAAVGMAGLGISTGVVAGVDSHLPAGTTGMSASMNTMTSFAPTVATAIGGKSALKAVKGLNKKRKNGLF